MVRKRKSRSDDLLNMLFELTGIFWQVGAVLTAGFIYFAILSFRWVRDSIAVAENSPMLAQLAETYGWVFFGLPIIFLALALFFGKKTFDAVVW